MRIFWRVLLALFLAFIIAGAALVATFPQESLAYYRSIKKQTIRYFYPKKKSTRYTTFKAHLPTDYNIHGIDVSFYQGEIDWDTVRAMKIKTDSITFAFVKATEGDYYTDKYFAYNWEETKRVGVLRGAYHYFRPDKDAAEQAYHFIRKVQIEEGDLPPVLDIEETRDVKPEELREMLKVFLDIWEKHYNITPIIYTSRAFYEANLGKDFRRYPLWVAQYKNLKTPRIRGHKWLFWQHSYEATVNGIEPLVDLNVFAGELQDLKNLCKK